MNLFSSAILGTGSAFPKKLLTNQELCQSVDTSESWIMERTGIQSRRIADPQNNPQETNSWLGTRAALQALERAGKKPSDVDQILYATCTPDTLIPSTACWVQQHLGASRAWAMDINAACSGFVYALATADQWIRSGAIQTSLIIGADLLSTFTNWKDRSSCILFGDGAGAIVLGRSQSETDPRILSTHLQSDGRLWDYFYIPAGGSNLETTPAVYEQSLHKMKMKGKEIFKEAVMKLTEFAEIALKAHGLSLEQLDWFIPHQANLRIIEAVAKRLKLPMEKVLVNLDRFGNTSSATVPTLLDEAVRQGRFRSGQHLLLDVFGAGLTYGSCLIRW